MLALRWWVLARKGVCDPPGLLPLPATPATQYEAARASSAPLLRASAVRMRRCSRAWLQTRDTVHLPGVCVLPRSEAIRDWDKVTGA
jgi:hypothetical protein